MKEAVTVVPYDEAWREEFREIARRLKEELGGEALRIDHIGSTAVPGLDAKPVIDIQISVRALEPMTYRAGIEAAGYVHRADNPDLTKRYFREREGAKRTHIHVREAGSWSEQFPLLFRDFLRGHEAFRKLYAEEKRALAARYSQPHERHSYVDGKDPIIWRIMREASKWSQRTGWRAEKEEP
ncbi:GrpB family protein [Saccharibacillus alkalitolerans]|uniref:GrpB family protein n=1 Tax=Saccharibacillus alkalitolerans TaxID=2705290 RepID=A0ABX0FBW1_9BACL|nr:GrpB family protein [Saccharibacillus alkalitolerans]NGZ76964.1 GrpB family protein [Saccharibacillus alkalitolerans]